MCLMYRHTVDTDVDMDMDMAMAMETETKLGRAWQAHYSTVCVLCTVECFVQ